MREIVFVLVFLFFSVADAVHNIFGSLHDVCSRPTCEELDRKITYLPAFRIQESERWGVMQIEP